ncbi:RNA-binding protein [Mycoplasma sp. 2045]|uniref:RNA-binding protein n=1 Tax=Mycoplasma sp. 2045 TaxID=2967301 RepID=UPI00211BBB73|nr:RNA-binding protein [Mycoplasma sp. 2045]UUM20611.1 RNA-binding protein [Mycoplasma sp. 2045]
MNTLLKKNINKQNLKVSRKENSQSFLGYKTGDVASAKIITSGSKFIKLHDKYGNSFLIYRKDITDFTHHQMSDLFLIGDIINFIVLNFDNNKKQGLGSFKKNHPNHQGKDFYKREKYYNELKATKNGFRNLINYTNSYFVENKKYDNKNNNHKNK